MKRFWIGLLVVVGLVLAFSFAFGAEHLGLAWEGYFAPKHASIKRDVFKETRGYNEGKAQELQKYYSEYVLAGADTGKKQGVAALVRMAFAEYNESKIESPQLREWLVQIRAGKLP